MKNAIPAMTKAVALALSVAALFPNTSYAWGRRGHQIVGETAAYLASQTEGAQGLKAHSFDIGYYANVPDIIWKRPATYDQEKPQHFMDMEIFEREFAKKPEIKNPFDLSRKDFETQFPELKQDAGRSYWRIKELLSSLNQYATSLKAAEKSSRKERHDLQGKWVVTAGVMAHYVGDLGQPMHVSENYDGNLTGQKGIHSYFEDTCVDEVYPRLQDKVNTLARKQWPEFKKKNEKKTTIEMLQGLSEGSKKELKELLAIDKKSKREDVKKTCPKYEALMTRRMAASALVLAELYRRELGWKFDDERFYFFAGEPEYIKPGEPAVATTLAPVTKQ